jgi:hypothetical protein
MLGAVHPLPQYTLMAWCSVKAQGQLYLFKSPLVFTVFCSDVAVPILFAITKHTFWEEDILCFKTVSYTFHQYQASI